MRDFHQLVHRRPIDANEFTDKTSTSSHPNPQLPSRSPSVFRVRKRYPQFTDSTDLGIRSRQRLESRDVFERCQRSTDTAVAGVAVSSLLYILGAVIDDR
jgi:hypothetical protein